MLGGQSDDVIVHSILEVFTRLSPLGRGVSI